MAIDYDSPRQAPEDEMTRTPLSHGSHARNATDALKVAHEDRRRAGCHKIWGTNAACSAVGHSHYVR